MKRWSSRLTTTAIPAANYLAQLESAASLMQTFIRRVDEAGIPRGEDGTADYDAVYPRGAEDQDTLERIWHDVCREHDVSQFQRRPKDG